LIWWMFMTAFQFSDQVKHFIVKVVHTALDIKFRTT